MWNTSSYDNLQSLIRLMPFFYKNVKKYTFLVFSRTWRRFSAHQVLKNQNLQTDKFVNNLLGIYRIILKQNANLLKKYISVQISYSKIVLLQYLFSQAKSW